MVKLIKFKEQVDLNGYTLIIPSVSVGNVGQLTIDLIITTYNLKKIATIWHSGIIPSVGGDPYEENAEEPCTACELYINKDLNIAVIQLRSSIELKLALQFFNSLKDEIINLKFSNVVILASSFAYEMHTIESSHFRYISNANYDFDHLNVLPMPPNEGGRCVIAGSGFAVKLYDILKDVIQSTLLIKYVSEGDNRPDAIKFMNIVKEYISELKNTKEKLEFPISWNYVFGNPPPIGIF